MATKTKTTPPGPNVVTPLILAKIIPRTIKIASAMPDSPIIPNMRTGL